MRSWRAVVVGLLVFVLHFAVFHASPRWDDPVILDGRALLESGPHGRTPPGNEIFIPVLFDGVAVNELEILRYSPITDTATFIPVMDNNAFALGAMTQVGGRMLFSFIPTPTFDLAAGICDLPCDDIADIDVDLVVTSTNTIDSASAASGNRFFVSGLNNLANPTISVRHSTDGSTWNLLHTVTVPAAGRVCPNFEGCQRIDTVVDGDETDLSNTTVMHFYESQTAAGQPTSKRVHRFTGTNSAFNVQVDTDIAPTGSFTNIETRCAMDRATLRIRCAYTHRQTQQLRLVEVDATGLISGPVSVGPAPVGLPFYALGLDPAGLAIAEALDGAFMVAPGAPITDTRAVEWNPPNQPFLRLGPRGNPGAATLTGWATPAAPEFKELFYFSDYDGTRDADSLGGGFAVSRYRVPLFDDGFETANTNRWALDIP